MTFLWPHLLWLLVLPAALLTWELLRTRRTTGASSTHPKILRAELGAHELSVVRETAPLTRAGIRPWLLVGLSLAIVALARPQWGRIEEPVFDQSREILIAIDLSRSMLSQDVKPSRLERAKLLVQALLEKLKGERVGLVVFSGTAFLQSPLSADYEILREFLPALTPDFLPEGGTNYQSLLDTALDAFGASSSADRFLIILSDGEATDDDWKPRIEELKKKGVRVIGLGVGTTGGTMIPDGSGGFVKDDRGAVVLSKLESSTLQELAAATGGTYRDASGWVDLAGVINQTVNTGRKGAFVDKNTIRRVDRFQWPLALALWCLLLSLYYEFPVKPRPRDIALHPASPGASGRKPSFPTATRSPGSIAAAIVAGLLLLGFPDRRAFAEVKVAPPATTSGPASSAPTAPGDPATLSRIVGRLADKDSLTAPDLSELAHETLNWGRRIKESGQPVPPGPVHDALQAVDMLQARGDKLADWSELRKSLQELLNEPPPPEKKHQQNQPEKNDDKQSSKNQDQDKDKSQQQQNQQQQNKSEDQKQQDQQKNDQSRDQKSQSSGQDQQKQQQTGESAFGDMKQQQQQPPKPTETQKVGGTPEKKENREPTDPALAVPMQKLEQLKEQDSPAELFQMMQSDRNQAARQKPKKDW